MNVYSNECLGNIERDGARVSVVEGHQGVQLSVRETGRGKGPTILLVHGWSQHSLAFKYQFQALADRFHLVAFDLRGHGASDKPSEASAYNNSAPWAGDVASVIAQMKLENPLLVGWSMGGWVVGDYLRVHGGDKLAGVSLVGSSITTGKHTPNGASLNRHEDVRAAGMNSDDQAANIAATVKFVRACTAEPLPPELFAEVVGLNMLAPPAVRAACRTRHEDYRNTYRALDLPVQVMWGSEERLAVPAYIDEMMDVIPNAEACCLDGLGHAPFLEDPARFNAALTEFAERCFA